LAHGAASSFDQSNSIPPFHNCPQGGFQKGNVGNHLGVGVRDLSNFATVTSDIQSSIRNPFLAPWDAYRGGGSNLLSFLPPFEINKNNTDNASELHMNFLRHQKEVQEQLIRSHYHQQSLFADAASTSFAAAAQRLGTAHSSDLRTKNTTPATGNGIDMPNEKMQKLLLMQLQQQAAIHNRNLRVSSLPSVAIPQQLSIFGDADDGVFPRRLAEQQNIVETKVFDNSMHPTSKKRPLSHDLPVVSGKNISPTTVNSTMIAESISHVGHERLQMALTLYKSEITAAIQRCMATSGFSTAEVMENHPTYVFLASKAVENEIDRVNKLRNRLSDNLEPITAPWKNSNSEVNCSKSAKEGRLDMDIDNGHSHSNCHDHMKHDGTSAANTSPSKPECGRSHLTCNGHMSHAAATSSKCSSKPKCSDSHSNCGNHAKQNGEATTYTCSSKTTNGNVSDEERRCNGRHIHRLLGKCGHQAIVHNPHDGRPHIDFVVGDRVECYQNISPTTFPRDKGGETIWPSRYKCIELLCSNSPASNHALVCKMFEKDEGDCQGLCDFVNQGYQSPLQIDASEIQGNKDEWNFDFLEDLADDSLLGLIELGNGKYENEKVTIEEHSASKE